MGIVYENDPMPESKPMPTDFNGHLQLQKEFTARLKEMDYRREELERELYDINLMTKTLSNALSVLADAINGPSENTEHRY